MGIEKKRKPIYLDSDIKSYLLQNIKEKVQNFSLNEIVNLLLKKDIEISQKLAIG